MFELCRLYGLKMGGNSARQLLKTLSLNNAVIGVSQLLIQVLLSTLKSFLILIAPLTGGLSLGPAAPIALAQAALGVHTTKLLGRLTTKILLKSNQKDGSEPSLMIKRLVNQEPAIANWVFTKPDRKPISGRKLQALLP